MFYLFTFLKVFGPKSQQRSIYEQAIAPIVNEVLDGFNCTVFAYGQTGTGKTYTMEGGMRNKVYSFCLLRLVKLICLWFTESVIK